MQSIQKNLRTCVASDGSFIIGVHKPCFKVELLRENKYIDTLGALPDGTLVKNESNFPQGNVEESGADYIYEIPNAFPFRGTTYINSAWAESKVNKPEQINLPPSQDCSLNKMLKDFFSESQSIKILSIKEFIAKLPLPLKIALAQSSTDPDDLLALVSLCCTIIYDENGSPLGLMFKKGKNGEEIPDINDHALFEIIANNPFLPDSYKQVMVLKPGIQGRSEITGEWLINNQSKFQCNESNADLIANDRINKITKNQSSKSHVFEYLRRNSYIPWGHFAANMADDTVRYNVRDLTLNDMLGMRHLYYKRTYLRLAEQLNVIFSSNLNVISQNTLEQLRIEIIKTLKQDNPPKLSFNGSLWGWNFGFGYAQSGYRLHASHQQIHQQYAMIPKEIFTIANEEGVNMNEAENQKFSCYTCGDMIADFIESYKNTTKKNFFETYIEAIRSNKRTDGKTNTKINADSNNNYLKDINRDCNQLLPSSLIVYEDDNIILFVPKAQTSQWELQLMVTKQCGNVLEADVGIRYSLDKTILIALQILETMGAKMVTSIEFSKRFDSDDNDQRLLYAFMPKMPDSPGAFSEAQLRWINGHYPEDFAESCRRAMFRNS